MKVLRTLVLAMAAASPLVSCCSSTPSDPSTGEREADELLGPFRDARVGETLLAGAAEGWQASLVIDNGDTGIWTVDSFQVFPQYGCPEVVGLDDAGRCWILVSYSGKWTPRPLIGEGEWLGGLAHGDLDPRVPGAELYTGGRKGELYQVVSYSNGTLDYRRIGTLPGREIHTLIVGDVDPRVEGRELLVLTRPGGLWRSTPDGPDGTFRMVDLGDPGGRVRDAVPLPGPAGSVARVACVSRAGWLRILTLGPDGPRWKSVYEASMGMGRLALRGGPPGEPAVLYSTHDDGRILRHEERRDGSWRTEVIHVSAQGPRGFAWGRLDRDPDVETVATFGYGRDVELLTRTPEGWRAEILFRDRDKGHWLAAAELDGRNDTSEILLSGYGARIVLLAREASPPPR